MPTAKVERKLAAILSADVKDYSRLTGADEVGTVRTLHACRAVTDSLIHHHRGRIVNTAGDSVLAEFASAVEALQCAVEIQHALKATNATVPPERRMEFRIGLNVGDVVVEGEELYGEGVNVAARLQALAEAGGIFMAGHVHDYVKNKVALQYEDLGEQTVKNIAEPVRVWQVVMDDAAAALAATQATLRQTRHEQELNEGGAGFQPAPTDTTGKPQHWLPIARLSRPAALAGIGILLLVGIVIGVQYLSVRLPTPSANIPPPQPSTLPLPDKPSIVVLPFVNMSEDPKQEYFSDGITEDLTSDLSKISSLFVIARNSAFTYKGKAMKVQDVSKELGVRYVLAGSVRRADNQVRITAQLIEATTGGHLWSERYDRPLQDIFALQDEVVRKIVTTLRLQLTVQEQGILVRKTTDNLAAYDYFLRGVEYRWRFTQEATAQARQMFEKALELDPKYAEAYTFLGSTYFAEWAFQWSQDAQALEQAFALAQKAVAVDDSLPVSHMFLGINYVFKKQYDQAIAEEERAIALDPNFAEAYTRLGDILKFAGRPEEAIGLIEKAMRLNPHYPRFCRKVVSNILLPTICGIFHVPSFQSVVWFINFATEPIKIPSDGYGTRSITEQGKS